MNRDPRLLPEGCYALIGDGGVWAVDIREARLYMPGAWVIEYGELCHDLYKSSKFVSRLPRWLGLRYMHWSACQKIRMYDWLSRYLQKRAARKKRRINWFAAYHHKEN